MTDDPTDTTTGTGPTPTPPAADGAQTAAAAAASQTAAADHGPAEGPVPLPTDRPEVLIGGAFAGGFLAAMILKRFGRR